MIRTIAFLVIAMMMGTGESVSSAIEPASRPATQPATQSATQPATIGGEYFQAEKGKYISIVVTVDPSDEHVDDFYRTQLQLGVTRIEFDKDGKTTLVSGVNPKITRMFGDDLKITSSTETVIAKNGVIELKLEGGKTLSLPIGPNRKCRIKNVDFLLNPKPSK